MIQANELRIGNYLQPLHIEDNFLLKDHHVVEPTTLMILNGDIDGNGFTFEPVPITEEFLFKFGFTQCFPFHVPTMTGLNGYFTFKDIDISYNDYGHWDCRLNSEYEHYVQIKYIHQLQNLYFALTGSELVLSTVPASNQF